MKRIVSTLLAVIGAFGAMAFAASYAEAQRHHHHRARVGVYIGAPLFMAPWPYYRPYYYDPYPYYSRPVVIREQPVVYVEQQSAEAPAPSPAPAPQALPQQQYWYFCQDTQIYYPHVQTCATPWQRVLPHGTR